jgi:hypothetical protein
MRSKQIYDWAITVKKGDRLLCKYYEKATIMEIRDIQKDAICYSGILFKIGEQWLDAAWFEAIERVVTE